VDLAENFGRAKFGAIIRLSRSQISINNNLYKPLILLYFMNKIKQAVEEGVVKKLPQDNYEKYRWFFTSSGNLVIGGKSAEQNEELVLKMIKQAVDYVVMHTKTPGSPFSFIIAPRDKVKTKDLEECAVFTGCFSRAWRENKKGAMVDIFSSLQINKKKNMKTGTFGVAGDVIRKEVELKLYFTKQKNKIRAVPQLNKNALCIIPGNIPKEKIAEELMEKLKAGKDEILNALPTGGFEIIK